MKVNSLKSLVAKGESLNLEFKLKANHPQRILNELVAFANSKGGQLLIGVDDNGVLNGLDDGDEDIYLLERLINEQIYPQLSCNIEKIAISKTKEIVIVEVAQGSKKPYYVNETGKKQGTAYVRIKDESIKAGKILRMLINSKHRSHVQSISFDEDLKPIFSLFKEKSELDLEYLIQKTGMSRRKAEFLMLELIKAGLLGFHFYNQDVFFLLDPNEKRYYPFMEFMPAKIETPS